MLFYRNRALLRLVGRTQFLPLISASLFCSSLNTVLPVQAQYSNEPRILPPPTDAVGGGNPLQGLGRTDDSTPSRRSQFESSDPSTSTPPAGSFNPNIPPNLLPEPSTDPIQLQREKEEKEKELEAQKKEEAKEKEKEGAAKSPSTVIDTPLKKALLALHLRNYEQSMAELDSIVETNPKNAEAHYLKAVILVLTRKYEAAAEEYRLVLKSAPSPTLSRRAKIGLSKLSR